MSRQCCDRVYLRDCKALQQVMVGLGWGKTCDWLILHQVIAPEEEFAIGVTQVGRSTNALGQGFEDHNGLCNWHVFAAGLTVPPDNGPLLTIKYLQATLLDADLMDRLISLCLVLFFRLPFPIVSGQILFGTPLCIAIYCTDTGLVLGMIRACHVRCERSWRWMSL